MKTLENLSSDEILELFETVMLDWNSADLKSILQNMLDEDKIQNYINEYWDPEDFDDPYEIGTI